VTLADEEVLRATASGADAPPESAMAVVAWQTDLVPPGGRHDNDAVNFRDVRLLPTAEELGSDAKPYLPLAGGANSFLEDPETRLIDRNFRLLRHDAVCAMKETISSQNRP